MLRLKKVLQGQLRKTSQRITYGFGVIALGLVFGLSIQFVKAWTNPTVTPPGGNVAGPLNTSAIAQTKSGDLLSSTLVGSSSNGSGNLVLATGAGSLPGYPSAYYPTLKTDATWIYLATGGAYNGYFGATGLRTRALYDFDNEGYYVNPNSTSVMYYLNRYYGFGGPEYDINNSGYYVDPNNTTRLATVSTDSVCIAGDCRTAWPQSVGDNLGNHTATAYLQMGGQWINVNGSGIYDSSRGHHLYPIDANYWAMRSPAGLVMKNNAGTTQGYLYHNGAGSMGLLDPNGAWRIRVSAGEQQFYGPTYVSGITDAENSGYYIDPNGTSNSYVSYRYYGFNGPEYDIQSSSYYVDPSATTSLANLTIANPPTVGSGSQSVYGWGMGSSSWPPRIGGYSPYTMNYHTGLAFSAHSVYGGLRFYNQSYPNLDSSTLVMQLTNNTVYIPSLYDSTNNGYYLNPDGTSNMYEFYRYYGFNGPEYDGNNGAYYVDPSGSTNLFRLCIQGVCQTSWPGGGISAETDTLQTVTSRGNTTNQGISAYTLRTNVYGPANGMVAPRWDTSFYVAQAQHYYAHTSTQTMYLGESNPVNVPGDIRTPILYDYNNTGYYVDPASTSNLYNVYRYYGYNGPEYDINSSAYYLDPSSVSILNDLRVNIMYDRQNTGYYVDPNNTSSFYAVNAYYFYYTSDRSLKKNIRPLSGALDKVLRLQGVAFDWKEDGTPSIGLIAQDVEKIYPDVVKEDEKTGLKSIQYGNLVSPIIEALKELNVKVDALLARSSNLEKETASQKAELQAHQETIEALQKEIESIKRAEHIQ